MTVREVARLFGCSTSTVYRMLKRGLLGRFEEKGLSVSKQGRRWKIERITPMAHVWDQWPVSNVTLAFPLGMPSDVALLGLCDMPADTPTEGTGICLSMVKFQIFDAVGDVRLAEEVSFPHDGKVQCVFGSKDLAALWKRLVPDSERMIYVTAWPRFYVIKDDGSALLEGDDRGYHAGEKVRSSTYTLSRNEHGELLIDGHAEPRPVDPGPTDEEQAEIDRSDRQMREEREAHERREREIKERAARENRENDERLERERAEREEAKRKAAAEADARRKRERGEQKAEHDRAAAERARLGIRAAGDITKALGDWPSEDSTYLALVNLWNAQYAPDDKEGFKERLRELRVDGFVTAVDEVCRCLDWTL